MRPSEVMVSAVLRVSVLVLVTSCALQLSNRQVGDPALCGNFHLDPGEICDDGNTTGGDGCSADCQSDETCGNGVIDVNEICDDSNGVGGDGCNATCTSDETCGNGVVDVSKGETCDDNNLIGGDGCSANCQSNEACGNNVVDIGEQCDRGGGFATDCDPDCTRPVCGDGVKNVPAGEECDDANLVSGDSCDGHCRKEMCGNGRKEDNEQCDSGGVATATCDPDCTLPVCGDGVRNAAKGEECDDHNGTSGDGCDKFCKVEVCGNNRREDNEACDTGGNSQTCNANCTPASCGDNYVNPARGETCDDGNTTNGDYCDASCHWEDIEYLVGAGDLVGIAYTDCIGFDQQYDDCAADTQTGFHWMDTSPYAPSSVTIEIDHTINCYGSASLGTELNGTSTGALTFGSANGCTCDAVDNLVETTISGSGYVRGGSNTFYVDPAPSCHGYSQGLGLGGYARITIHP